MAPSEYSLRLQKGIQGGFAPPNPESIYLLNKAATHPSILIAAAVRPDGTPSLQEVGTTSLDAGHTHTDSLVTELHGILKGLPREDPPGSQDIYGMDTSIAWQSDDLEWYNGGPEGCGGGMSTIRATEEEKKRFKRAVEIVHELVEKGKVV